MPSRSSPLAVACAVAFALSVSGCAGPPLPPSPTPGATIEPAPTPAAAADDQPLDPQSRELVAIAGIDEVMRVTVWTTWAADLRDTARAAGMTAAITEPGASVEIDGALGDALALARTAPVAAIRVEDLRTAMRPIPLDRPAVEVPLPGRPYLGVGFAGGLPRVSLAAPQREPMLRGLATSIETIDGRPYARLEIEGGCAMDKGGASCRLVAVGFTRAGGSSQDELSVAGTAPTGWAGLLEPLSVVRWSVPRPLLRAAEWIARHDADAPARIRTYASCCVATWDPARPGVITLEYERPCGPALGSIGRERADTGECSDRLRVAVDVGASAVISIEERVGTA